MLRLLGKEVNTAHDGLEAVEQAERFRPEVILMDIGMPKLNGLESRSEFASRLGESDYRDRAELVGGSRATGSVSRGRVRCHLVKPVKYDDLQKLLGELRGKRY